MSSSERTVVIAQARMSSTRLPGKVMADLGGRSVVDHVIERCRKAEGVDDVWIATTTDPTDNVLVQHLMALDVAFVRGDLDDVLSRYVLAADAAAAEVVVRITCDCPMIDPVVIDATIGAFFESPTVDYCSNTLMRTYPLGMDTEVFSASVLRRAAREARQDHEREHVTPYIYQHPERFILQNTEAPEWARWSELRLTLDEPADLQLLEGLVAELGIAAGLREIIDLLRERPDLVAINSDVAHRHVEKPSDW